MAKALQEVIDELKVELAGMTSARLSNSTYIDRLLAAVENAKDDADEVQAVVDGFRAEKQAILDKIAEGTVVENEPPV